MGYIAKIVVLFTIISSASTELLASSSIVKKVLLPKGCEKASHYIFFHTNDNHGAVFSGALSRQATYLKHQKEKDLDKYKCPAFLTVSAGDIMSGDIASDILDNVPDFLTLGKLGYSAMTLGNHDFDRGLKTIETLASKKIPFPVLGANIFDRRTQKLRFKSHIIFEIANNRNETVQKIALIGLTTESAGKNSITDEEKSLIEFKDPISTASTLVSQIKTQHRVDLIGVLAHLGGSQKNGYKGGTSSKQLAEALNGDVRFIIDGHEHEVLHEPIEIKVSSKTATLIVSAGESGKYVGHLVIPSQNEDKFGYELAEINEKFEKNREIELSLNTFKTNQKTKKYFETLFKQNNILFEGSRSVVLKRPTNLSRLLNDATKFCGNADVSIITPNSVRTSLMKGKLTAGDWANVSPFINENATISVATITGKELREIIDLADSKRRQSNEPFFYFSFTNSDKSLIEPTKLYRVAALYWIFNDLLEKRFKATKIKSGKNDYHIPNCIIDYVKSFTNKQRFEEFERLYP